MLNTIKNKEEQVKSRWLSGKKIYFILFFLPLMSALSHAQLSITPNSAYRSQTLSTVITDPSFTLTLPSAPQYLWDIYLYKSGFHIYSTSFTIIDFTTLHASFTIPNNAPSGLYDVYVWPYFPVTLYSGFTITGSDIIGYVYNDANSNGVHDAGELKLSQKQTLLQSGNHVAITDINGNYFYGLPNGNYMVANVADTAWSLTSSPSTYSVNTTANSVSGINFGLHANNQWYGISTLLGCESFARCNWSRDYTIVIHNYGTAIQNGTVQFTKASILSHVNATPTPTTFVGNNYTWDYFNLQPNAYLSFTVRLAIPNLPGTPIDNYAFTTARDLSGNVVDTSGFHLYQTIICSYDPNDKVVYPTGDATPQHYTNINAELFYTIHFTNTGNDTAFEINIYDTLDVSLDLSTFVFAGSSHFVQTYIEPNRKVRFYFPNINLPDSTTDESNSHGFVSYRIKPLFGLPDFTAVRNKAYIVFDQNPAIVTDTTLNTLVSFPTGSPDNVVLDADANFFPNPVADESVLMINQKGKHSYQLMIYDASGQLVKTAAFTSNNYVLKKKEFASGLYLYRLRETNGNLIKSGKLVIE